MKTCPSCGGQFQDRFLYCVRDGRRLDPDATEGRPAQERKNIPNSSVLYCPVCSGEYPLTFSLCPLDGLRLVRERPFAKLHKAITTATLDAPAESAPEVLPLPSVEENPVQPPVPIRQATTNSYSLAAVTAEVLVPEEVVADTAELPPEPPEADEADEVEEREAATEFADRGPRELRLAAVIVTTSLILLGLGGGYMLLSIPTQPPLSSAAAVVEPIPPATTKPLFIPTPRAALEYKEEATEKAAAPAPVEDTPRREEGESKRAPQNRAANDAGDRKTPPTVTVKVEDKGAAVTDRRISARLVRMRSRRTHRGYRYDLTFTMREQAGRPVRWNLLTINSRSSRGVSRSETIPFTPRLGPGDMLTFTVSVEMPGRAEADWRGRVACTSAGADEARRPVRATFGTDVAP